MISIPPHFLTIPYNGDNFPGAEGFDGLTEGANCQVFAYTLLAHHGIELPLFRSSELWDDDQFTRVVTDFEPLDLLLFHETNQAFGAHIGVYVGDGYVLHLAKHRGLPIVETIAELQKHPRHRVFIGTKRVRNEYSACRDDRNR